MSIRVTMISGRDNPQMMAQARKSRIASKQPVEVLIHPWATVHVADAAKAFMQMLKVRAKTDRRLIIVTTQDWLANLLGEVIALKPELLSREAVEVFLCEGGETRRFTYNEQGFLSDGWPVGYFTYDDLTAIIKGTRHRPRKERLMDTTQTTTEPAEPNIDGFKFRRKKIGTNGSALTVFTASTSGQDDDGGVDIFRLEHSRKGIFIVPIDSTATAAFMRVLGHGVDHGTQNMILAPLGKDVENLCHRFWLKDVLAVGDDIARYMDQDEDCTALAAYLRTEWKKANQEYSHKRRQFLCY